MAGEILIGPTGNASKAELHDIFFADTGSDSIETVVELGSDCRIHDSDIGGAQATSPGVAVRFKGGDASAVGNIIRGGFYAVEFTASRGSSLGNYLDFPGTAYHVTKTATGPGFAMDHVNGIGDGLPYVVNDGGVEPLMGHDSHVNVDTTVVRTHGMIHYWDNADKQYKLGDFATFADIPKGTALGASEGNNAMDGKGTLSSS